VAAAVVHGDRHATISGMIMLGRDQVRMTSRALVRCGNLHLLQQLCVDKRALFRRSRHCFYLLSVVAAAHDSRSLCFLPRVL
jgi:hypothetical protein